MANIKSQKKRVKTNEKARQRNKAIKSELRTHVRNFRAAVAEGDKAKAVELSRVANRALDPLGGPGAVSRMLRQSQTNGEQCTKLDSTGKNT